MATTLVAIRPWLPSDLRDRRQLGGCGMFFISRDRTQCVSIGASRLFAVALTVVTLAACTQHSVVTDKSASLATSRQTPPSSTGRQRSPRPSRRPSRHAQIVASKHGRRAKNPSRPRATSPRPRPQMRRMHRMDSPATAGGNQDRERRKVQYELTAADAAVRHARAGHRLATGRAVTVRINDRGPFVAGRIVDVSQAALIAGNGRPRRGEDQTRRCSIAAGSAVGRNRFIAPLAARIATSPCSNNIFLISWESRLHPEHEFEC